MKRVIYYFDGFNFYNGLKEKCKSAPEWKKYYWLDFVLFCQQFTPNDQQIEAVKYFTSPPLNVGKRSRQSTLLSANLLLNPTIFQVINGKYFSKNITCKLCSNVFQQPEEKRTDVNISVHLLMDCFQNNADKLILITADSDLIPPIQAIKKFFPDKSIKVYFPPNRSSSDLFNICKPVVYLEKNKTKFDASIMNDTISAKGKIFTKPVEWVIK